MKPAKWMEMEMGQEPDSGGRARLVPGETERYKSHGVPFLGVPLQGHQFGCFCVPALELSGFME